MESNMFELIHGNLTRQFKGLELLNMLLDEELEFLQARDTDAIANQEFTIHELLRQIAVERVELKKTMQGTRLLEYADLLSEEEDGKKIRKLVYLIDSLEQQCSKQASMNAELALALMDQSQSLLSFFHEQIQPKNTANIYGARGRIREHRPSAALITGRL